LSDSEPPLCPLCECEMVIVNPIGYKMGGEILVKGGKRWRCLVHKHIEISLEDPK